MTQLQSLLYQRADLNRQLIVAAKANSPHLAEIKDAVARADKMLDELMHENVAQAASLPIPGDQHANHI